MLQFTLREKIIRGLNKFPRPIVMAFGLFVMIMGNYVESLIAPEFGEKIGGFAMYFLFVVGLYIIFSPEEYRLLKTKEEMIKDKDERHQLIKTKAGARVNELMTTVYCVAIWICVSSERIFGAIVVGVILLIQIILECFYNRKFSKIM